MLQIAFKFFQLNLLKKYNQSNELKQKKRKTKQKRNKNKHYGKSAKENVKNKS